MKEMITSVTSFLGFCLAVFTPTVGHSAVIYDNGVANQVGLVKSFSFTSTLGQGHQYQITDDFLLPGDGQWMVNGASWTGVLGSALTGGLQPTVGETLDFDLLILPDNNSRPAGTPQDPLPGTAVAHRQVQVTGTSTGVDNQVRVAEFETSFEPINLEGGMRYWLVVAARGEYDYQESNRGGIGWMWSGKSNTGNAWQGGADFRDSWGYNARQQLFSLFGEEVSELSAGDFDVDGDVDGADFLAWQRDPSVGNLSDWQNNYAIAALPLSASLSQAVPEPTTLMLLAATFPLLLSQRKRHQ